MLEVYDRVLPSKDINTLIGLFLIAFFFFIIFGILERYRNLILLEIAELIEVQLRLKIIQISSIDFKKVNLIKDLDFFKKFISGQPTISFLDAPWIIIYIAVLFVFHSLLGYFALSAVIILIVISLLNYKFNSQIMINYNQRHFEENQFLNNLELSGQSIQSMGMQLQIFAKMNDKRNETQKIQKSLNYLSANIGSLIKFFKIFFQSFGFFFSSYLAVSGDITFGSIIATTILFTRALAPIDGVISLFNQYPAFKIISKNLSEVISLDNQIELEVQSYIPKGEYSLENVFLNSSRKKNLNILKNINFKIKQNETIAIVGLSGCGKSSLLQIIAGLKKPYLGNIFLDDLNLTDWNLEHLGKNVGYLCQSETFLSGTISENISRFNGDKNKVIKAAKLAGVHEMLQSMPDRYNTFIDPNGSTLSQGQKKKISLARAFYDDPKILLLDEPGDSLDEISTKKIIQSLLAFKKNMSTIILTTHHPLFLSIVDKIIFLEDGVVKFFGTKKSVLEKLNGYYDKK